MTSKTLRTPWWPVFSSCLSQLSTSTSTFSKKASKTTSKTQLPTWCHRCTSRLALTAKISRSNISCVRVAKARARSLTRPLVRSSRYPLKRNSAAFSSAGTWSLHPRCRDAHQTHPQLSQDMSIESHRSGPVTKTHLCNLMKWSFGFCLRFLTMLAWRTGETSTATSTPGSHLHSWTNTLSLRAKQIILLQLAKRTLTHACFSQFKASESLRLRSKLTESCKTASRVWKVISKTNQCQRRELWESSLKSATMRSCAFRQALNSQWILNRTRS